MNVWLITIGEPLPTDEEGQRLFRAGRLANFLVNRGHSVVWWSSTVDHYRKIQRNTRSKELNVRQGLKLWLLFGRLYKKNVSLSRILNHREIAREFKRLSKNSNLPDIIVCSYPPIELTLEAVRYGSKNQIPVVVDVRDLWPDIFLELVPRYSKILASIVLVPLFSMATSVFRDCYAIVGVSAELVEWALKKGKRDKTAHDRPFFLAYSRSQLSDYELRAANEFWNRQGISKENMFIICYFGNMSNRIELETVILTAKLLMDRKIADIRFVLCGEGEAVEGLKNNAKGFDNVIFPGWVNQAAISVLMERSRLGILPYPSSDDLRQIMPNKIGEYLSSGLPIVSSLRGIVEIFLEDYECGVTYPNKEPERLCEILVELKSDERLLERLSENAKSVFDKMFDEDVVYGQYTMYLEELSQQFHCSNAHSRVNGPIKYSTKR